MIYCRWSDDDCQCDAYCYESYSGEWVTHVAENRVTFPPIVPFGNEYFDAWRERNRLVRAGLETAECRPIGLRYDGQTFCDSSPSDAADTLQLLKDVGYNVPQHAIDALHNESGDFNGAGE